MIANSRDPVQDIHMMVARLQHVRPMNPHSLVPVVLPARLSGMQCKDGITGGDEGLLLPEEHIRPVDLVKHVAN